MVELLKQGQFTPFNVIDQCISIYAASKGFLDDVALTKVSAFEKGMLEYFQGPGKAVRDQLVEKKSFKGLEDQFNAAIKAFKATFK